ncbi:hypothetical protein C8F01DRAFT_1363193 [Mycena amicta]|nr:hypothetical protein C8F01DRAFT_1363193 [Mycena amicta]
MPGVLPAGVLLDSLTTQPYDSDAELVHWERLIFSFDMDPNPNDPNANKNNRQSAEDIQTAALLTQLAAASNLFPMDTSYAQRQAHFNEQQFVSPTSVGPQGYDPRLYSPPIQPYNPHAVPAARSHHPQPGPSQSHAGPSTATATSSPDADRDYVEDDYEDKRRRNTAASARFRIKKKMRGLELERSVSDLTGRAEELEREAADLRRENGWLKEIVMLKGGHLTGIDLSGGMGRRPQEKKREEEESTSESEAEKDRKGKGKARKRK